MATDITLRSTKGSALTHDEMDTNLTNLQTTADAAVATAATLTADKAEATALGVANTDQNMGSFTGSTISDNVSAKAAIQALETAVETKANATAVGVTASAANMGAYTGATIPDNETAKQNIQSLETAVETKANASALGVTASAADMGTFTGSTIADSQTGKQALQALETAVETKANASALGVTSSAANMGTYTGSTITDNQTAKQNIQELETSLETKAPSAFSHSTSYSAGTVGAKLKQIINIKDAPYNAAGDGVTNDRAAFVSAVADARGKTLVIPEGNYLINTDGGSITLEEVTLQGEGVLDGANGSIDQGAVLHFTGTTNSPFKVRRGTTVEGLGFYYPNQTDSASPTAYPPIFAFDFTNGAVQFVFIRDNVAFNAYKFADIDDSAGGVGHVWIEDNTICALNRGIYLRRNLEHLRICGNNFTFGHWLAATEAGARAYVRANAIYIEVAESDGVEIFDNLFFGSLNAIKTSGTGLCQFMLIEQNKFDQVRRGVLATGSGRFDGSIINNTFNCFNGQDTTLQGRSIDIQTTGAGKESISITANSFLMATEDHIFVSGNTPTRDILIGPNNYRLWAVYKAAGAYGAINAGGTNTNITVSGGWFVGADYSAYANGIMGSPNVFQCTGATFNACLAATNVTTNTAILTGNVSYSTNGATSDVLTATNAWQTGNKWDKPSTTSTKPAFLVRKSASQTFNSGTLTDAVWGNEVTDKGGNFASNVFTAPVAGRYRFEWSLMHDNTGVAGDRWVIVLLTSAGNFSRSYQMIADYNSVSGSAMVELATSGTAKIQVQRVGGAGNFVTHNDGDYNYFSGALIE